MYAKAYVEITDICNKNCSFCHGTKRPLRRMTMEEFQTITARLRGVTEYLYFHLMGEPLTHPLLPELIRCAAEQGFKVAITTNGTLLPKVGDAMIASGVYKVNISVHSFEEGSREAYLEYIHGCLDFANHASQSGVLTVLRLWNNGYDKGRNINTLELLHQRFGGDWVEGRRGIKLRDKLYLEHGERFDWPDLAAPDYGDRVFCYGLKDQFGILCDGSVVPCCLDGDGVITLGNIFAQPLGEILGSPRAVAMKQGFANRKATEELCCHCGYARRFG